MVWRKDFVGNSPGLGDGSLWGQRQDTHVIQTAGAEENVVQSFLVGRQLGFFPLQRKANKLIESGAGGWWEGGGVVKKLTISL